MKSIRQILVLAVTVMLSGSLYAQNISEIAKSDPLIISGAVGTQNTYRYSSVGNGYGSPALKQHGVCKPEYQPIWFQHAVLVVL